MAPEQPERSGTDPRVETDEQIENPASGAGPQGLGTGAEDRRVEYVLRRTMARQTFFSPWSVRRA